MLRLLFVILLLGLSPLAAQQYDLILKGGHVIDPGNELDGVLDVGIKDGRIDLHAHVYGYSGSIYPDDTALKTQLLA